MPTFVTITHAHEVPDLGGETEFVSTRAACDRLPDAKRDEIAPLNVIRDYVFSRSKVAPVPKFQNIGAPRPLTAPTTFSRSLCFWVEWRAGRGRRP